MMRIITVKGVGNVSAKPDYIMISMTIRSVEKDYDKATKLSKERMIIPGANHGDLYDRTDVISFEKTLLTES